jgi:Ca2+-transporting ATPase
MAAPGLGEDEARRGALQQRGDDSSASPTELAVLEMARASGADVGAILSCYAREAEIPFDSSRKRMSVSVLRRSGERFVFTKGAPDVLMRCCSSCMMGDRIVPFGPSERERTEKLLSGMASEALRVIAFAFKPCSGGPISENGLTFIGMAGLADPPRPEARPAVLKCRSSGIRTVLITGDHRDTAVAVAREIGIPADSASVMTGAEIDALSDRRFAEKADGIRVFARVTPAHKMRIVRALKASGHTVAMTGDGVNDAPAVRAADIGVSMGKGGTDVTREASGIVLLDDNFATLVSAVEEGRIIYENIRKFIRYLLSCNIGEVVTMFAGMLIGLPVVLLPIQILMINLVTDGLPAIALGFDPPQSDPMALPPRPRNESVFSRGLGFPIVTRGLLIGLSVLLAFTSVLRRGESLAAARTCAFAALVLTQLVHSFECKSENRSLFTIRLLNNWKLIGASAVSLSIVLACIYVPSLAEIFDTVPLGWGYRKSAALFRSGAARLRGAHADAAGKIRPTFYKKEARSRPALCSRRRAAPFGFLIFAVSAPMQIFSSPFAPVERSLPPYDIPRTRRYKRRSSRARDNRRFPYGRPASYGKSAPERLGQQSSFYTRPVRRTGKIFPAFLNRTSFSEKKRPLRFPGRAFCLIFFISAGRWR